MITLCLVMIVKNESRVILRCLESVADYIDSYCICDTGSSDDTQKIIKSFFKKRKIPGKLLQHQWKNFGHNRTLAVRSAKGMADYLLLMDADFVFIPRNKDFKQKTFKEGQYLIKYAGKLDYCQPLMVNGNLDWKYIGVTHEYIHCDGATRDYCHDFIFHHIGDGSNKNNKFERDIALLEQGLIEEPNNMRYYFYLGQSNKDLAGSLKLQLATIQKQLDELKDNKKENKQINAKIKELTTQVNSHFQKAIDAYTSRLQKQDFPEEVYYAKYMLGYCHYHLGSPVPIWSGWFLDAYSYRPKRLEALYNLIKYYRIEKIYHLAYDLGYRAADSDYPHGDCLFIDSAIHKYLLKHEVAMAAYYLGKMHESLKWVNQILDIKDLPPNHRQIVLQHQKLCLDKIQEEQSWIKNMESTGSVVPKIAFFTYNELHTGGAELSFANLMQYLQSETNYIVKHIRDYRDIYHFKPNLLICQQYAIQKGIEIATELNIPIAVTQHGPNQWQFAKRSTYFLFNSNAVATTEIARTTIPHYDIVWPHIDINAFKKIDNSNEFDRQYISFIGRPTQAKGIRTFLELAVAMPEHQFLVAGGDIPEQYVGLIGKNVKIYGFTTDIQKVYSITKILIIPSFYESFGRVAVEASLCQIPVIANDLPGIREATGNLSTYIKNNHDINQWKEAVLEILNQYPKYVQITDQISEYYTSKHLEQLQIFKININHLLNNNYPCKYTHGLKFTITISVYNRPIKVIRAINSILQQTLGKEYYEIIIVDDYSTDNGATVNAIKEKIDELYYGNGNGISIRLIENQTNRGTYYCRNLAISQAKGDYILNLDSDDQLVPNCLEVLRDHIWNTGSKIIQFKFYRDKTGDLLTNDAWKELTNRKDLLNHSFTSWGHFCIERNYMLDKIGYYDNVRFGADTEFMCRCKNFHKTTNIDNILYYAEKDEKSLTNQVNPLWAQQYITNFMNWYQSKPNTTKLDWNLDDTNVDRPFPLPEVDLFSK